MNVEILKNKLILKHAFTISRGSRTYVENAIVVLRKGEYFGLGEATANPYYHISADIIEKDILHLTQLLKEYNFSTPEKLWNDIAPILRNNPFALCALDVAAHDLYGKIMHKPLYQIWGLSLDNLPLSNFTIGIDEVDVMLRKMKDTPWPIYKIKLGTENDIEIVKALRKETDAIFRVDANGGWNVDQCVKFSETFKQLGVEFLEQPLPANCDKAMQLEACKYTQLPLIADESCIDEKDVSACKGYFHGVNIKLMKCGGITPARRMIDQAKKLGMSVMVGCMTESSVGISAISQLAPLLDYVDMDGALLLSNNPAKGAALLNGEIVINNIPGTGAELLTK